MNISKEDVEEIFSFWYAQEESGYILEEDKSLSAEEKAKLATQYFFEVLDFLKNKE